MAKVNWFLTLIILLNACTYPRVIQKSTRSFNTRLSLTDIDTLNVEYYYFSAHQRKNTGIAPPYEELYLSLDFEKMLVASLKHPRIQFSNLRQPNEFQDLFQTKVRKEAIENLISGGSGDFSLVPIVKYYARYQPKREDGGPVGLSSFTGEDLYWIELEVNVAIFKKGKLMYLNNSFLLDKKIVPSGTPITHEFPQEVLDTLMQMALEPLLKQLDRNK